MSTSIFSTGLVGQVLQSRGVNTVWVDEVDPFNGLSENNPISAKTQHLTLKVDSLVLACARHRLAKEPEYADLHDILSEKVYSKVEDADTTLAAEIREYYSGKMMWWELNEVRLTEYQIALKKYILSDPLEVVESNIGLVHKIPEFYASDRFMDSFKENSKTRIEPDLQVKYYNDGFGNVSRVNEIIEVELTPLKSQQIANRRVKRSEYYFHDSDKYLYRLSVEKGNDLEHIFKYFFERHTSLKFSGYKKINHSFDRQGIDFYELFKWNLVLD
jgi:hypothetical protein